jgi:peptidyl-prolyl cis-trans isomerase D
MAVIGKIRQRAGLLIGLVGFSLAAFILGDLLTSNRSFLGGQETDVAVIGKTRVSVQEFEAMVNKLADNYKVNTGTQTIDQQTMESLREQAWTELMSEEVLMKQINKTGLAVSSDELFDMIQGKNPHPQIKQTFTDPNTGEFSPANVIQFLKNMDSDPSGATRLQWIAFEKFIQDERLRKKYDEMIQNGIFVTSVEGEQDYYHKNKKYSITYVGLPYGSIEDSAVSVTDDQLRAYYNSHKQDFEREASRKIEYVVFEVTPSEEDRRKVLEDVTALVDEFRNSSDDSLFIAINADSREPMSWFKEGELSPVIDTLFFSDQTVAGTVYGPYEENSAFKAAKLVESGMRSDSIKVSHALVSFIGAQRAAEEITRNRDEAQARADSLFEILQREPAKFEDFATNQSDDKVSAQDAGNLDWLTPQSAMDPKFLEGAFNTNKGGISLVESPFGFHIIKVTDAKDPVKQVKVAYVDRRIEPGSKTYQSIYSSANEFAGNNRTGEQFEAAVKEEGLTKRVADNLKETDKAIPGLENPRSLVIWAYRAEVGEVSKPYEFGNKFVVAHLVAAQEDGVAPLDAVRGEVEGFVITENKAAILIEDLNEAMESASGLEQLAPALGAEISTSSNVNFGSTFIEGIGVEPALIAKVIATEKGGLTGAVKGQSGVFIARVDDITEPAEPTDVSSSTGQMESQVRQRASYEVFEALKEKANVVDNRGKFY